jgi:hypothetical protein
MTMLDKDLMMGEDARPVITPGASILNHLLPTTAGPNYLDLRVAMDWARGKQIYANFRVQTPFDAVALNYLRFAVYVDSVTNFANVLTNTELTLVRGPDMLSSGLNVQGLVTSLAIPPHNSLVQLVAQGRRYICLGFQAYVPSADWGTGGIDAFFADAPLAPPQIDYASGY